MGWRRTSPSYLCWTVSSIRSWGNCWYKDLLTKKLHCKAQPALEHSGIWISYECTAASGIAMVTSERKNQGLHKPHTTKMKWNQLVAICNVTILREGQMVRWMHDLHIMAQLWHHSPSAPMDTSFTPLLAIKSSALLTFEILWTLILPLSGLAKRSPEQEEADRLLVIGIRLLMYLAVAVNTVSRGQLLLISAWKGRECS